MCTLPILFDVPRVITVRKRRRLKASEDEISIREVFVLWASLML